MLSDSKITQKYLRRYGLDTKRSKSWAGRMVHIQTENGVWRTGGAGYTWEGKENAWILPFEDAVTQISHCGPEKRGAFIDVSKVNVIGDRSIADWRVFARRDDCLDRMVPSDLRQLISTLTQ